MQTFRFGEVVEVRPLDEWHRAIYLEPYDDKVSNKAHRVVVEDLGEFEFADRDIRPLPRFEATGDDLAIVTAALCEHYHDSVELDIKMAHHGVITNRTLRVRQLHEAAKAAMEAGR